MKKCLAVLVFLIVILASLHSNAASCPTYQTAASQPISEKDLTGCTCPGLRLLRNEIFARHGRVFNSPDLDQYFRQKAWYKPNNSSGTSGQNRFERSNVSTIAKVESLRGCGGKKTQQSEKAKIFAACDTFVKANSAPEFKYKLKLLNQKGKWALVDIVPLIDAEGAMIILEKQGNTWKVKDWGPFLDEWRSKVPDLFK